jgi:hypothetical protein
MGKDPAEEPERDIQEEDPTPRSGKGHDRRLARIASVGKS